MNTTQQKTPYKKNYINRHIVQEKGEQSMTEFMNIEKSADGWVAYDTLLKTSKKFRASSLLNSSLQKLGDHLLVTYEAFGREYLLSH